MTERILNCDASGRLTDRSFLADPALARLLALLNRDGEEARVVGGAVRNALLGLTPGDIDVTTTARPEVVMERARVAKFRTVPTGLAHGTVTVVVAGRPFEVTTLREDVETDGRHAVVRFGRDFAADALRRDFTINALSVSTDERIHDYAGGCPTCPPDASASSENRHSEFGRTISASCASFASLPPMPSADWTEPASKPHARSAPESRICRVSGSGANCSSSCRLPELPMPCRPCSAPSCSI